MVLGGGDSTHVVYLGEAHPSPGTQLVWSQEFFFSEMSSHTKVK